MPEMVLNDILTPSEVAELLRTSEKCVLALFRRGELPGKKIGKDWRSSRSMLKEWFSDWQPNTFDPNKRAGEILEALNGKKKGI